MATDCRGEGGVGVGVKDVGQGVSLATRKRMGMLLRERKKSHAGKKGEKYLDVLYVEIKIPEKIFYR